MDDGCFQYLFVKMCTPGCNAVCILKGSYKVFRQRTRHGSVCLSIYDKTVRCSEGLDASIFFVKLVLQYRVQYS